MANLGFSVQLFFPTGDPQGIRIVGRPGWTGQGVVFPRVRLAEAGKRDELKRVGIYLLWVSDDGEDRPRIYVGQSDTVANRMLSHDSEKDFWTHAVVFTCKDDTFNSAHARYLEAELVQVGRERNRATLENSNKPSHPRLSEADRAYASDFLEKMLTCVEVVGISAFHDVSRQSEPDGIEHLEFVLEARGVQAKMRVEADPQEFVVLVGSQMHKNPVRSMLERPEFRGAVRRREEVIASSSVVDEGDAYRLVDELRFGSPSAVNKCIFGDVLAPYADWKTSDGRTLGSVIRGDES